MKKALIYFLFSLSSLISASLFAQGNYGSEEELKKKAAELFAANKLVEANPMYAQLLSLYPKDLEYNYKYGACLLAADADKQKAMKYLNFATSKPNPDPLAYFYLGKGHHLNYNFAKAVKAYSKFKNKASTNLATKFQVERNIEMCKNGNNLLSRLNEVQVVEKQVIKKKDFFRIYDLEGVDGKIITTPEDFLSKEDKKRNEKSIIYLPPSAKEVYYASYGKKGENGKDIYKRVRLGNGNWSEPVSLGESINTSYDEDYAFIHPDGRTLYFASKGHSSMGGYDIFMSTFDESIADWTAPVNLDFAFSSADDDILFITDASKVLAYFASSRTNAADEITVYKVLVEKAPADLSVIKGKFIAESQPDMKSAKITVIDQATNQTVGIYQTDKNGNYQVEIASNGGEYKFNLETTDDAPIHTGIVKIPKQDEFEVLGQELRLVGEGDQQQLVIKNIFDGTAAANYKSKGPLVSSEILRKKASLEVNFNASQLADASPTKIDNQLPSKPSNQGGTRPTDQGSTKPSNQGNTKPNNQEIDGLATKQDDQNSDANASSTSSNLLSKEELASRVKQSQSNLDKFYSDLVSASNTAFKQAEERKTEADNLFNQVEEQKSNGSAESDWKETETFAQEAALQSTLISEIATELEKELTNASRNKQANDQIINNINESIANGDLNRANDLYSQLSTANENAITVQNSLKQGSKELQNRLRTNASKVSNFKEKQDALAAENLALADQLESMRDAYANSSGGKKKEIAQRLDELVLDSSDMAYQLQKAKADYNKALVNESAMQFELQERELLTNKLDEGLVSDKTYSEQEKRDIVESINEFDSENKLGRFAENASLAALDIQPSNPNSTAGNGASNTRETTGLPQNAIDLATVNAKFDGRLQSISQNLSESERRTEEKSIYESWIQELEAAKKQNQDLVLNTSNEVEKDRLNAEVNLFNTEIAQKNKLLAAVEVSNNQSDNLADNQTSNQEGSNALIEDKPLPSSNADLSQVNETTEIDNENAVFTLEQSFNYGSPNAQQGLLPIKQALVEAEDLSIRAETAKQSAFTLPTVEQRNDAFERSNALEKASEKKQIEAINQYAQVNRQEFQANSRLLRQANNFDIDFESNNLDIANLLSEEAELYYSQAIEIRSTVDQNQRTSKIAAELQKAYDYEMLALRKQGEALNKLAIVDTEYLNKEDATPQSRRIRASEYATVQTITDPEILTITDAAVAQAKGDSLSAIVEDLRAQSNLVQSQVADMPVGAERDSLIAVYEALDAEADQARIRAAVYYERQAQINAGVVSGGSTVAGISNQILKPELGTSKNIALDTVNVDDERAQVILTSSAYLNYVNRTQEKLRLIKEANIAYDEANELLEEKVILEQKAENQRKAAESETDQAEKERLIREATVFDQRATAKQVSIDSLNAIIETKNQAILDVDKEMQNAIAGLSEYEQLEIQKLASINLSEELAAVETSRTAQELDPLSSSQSDTPAANSATDQTSLVDNNTAERNTNNISQRESRPQSINPIQPSASRRISLENIDLVPKNVKSAIFVSLSSNESAYDVNKPIPMATKAKMPEGLIYKVQVGAFRNPIPQNLFKGFAPLMGENGPNGIIRYTAGIFLSEAQAVYARDEIRKLGYSDAFVVAFLNGERISISRARTEKPEQARAGLGDLALSSSAGSANTTAGSTTPSFNASNEPLAQKYKAANVQSVRHVNEVKEVFYTIQIGVFSKPVPKGTFDLNNLTVKPLAGGLTRYNSGIYQTAQQAQQAKDRIVNDIKDAFITAYYKGKRISLAEAARIQNQ